MKRYIFLLFIISFKFYGQINTNADVLNISPMVNNQEWEKFNTFKEQIKSTSTEDYLNKIRIYSKDSLKTLAIKLISIKELKEKKLLQKDISLNTEYYVRLLDELQSSEMNNLEYFFLEKELVNYSLEKIKRKHTTSIVLNIIFLSVIIFLIYLVYSIKLKSSSIRTEELSGQENKIKNHIIEGKSNKEIAEELFISLSTVKTHITNIYQKLNVTNRKELIVKFSK